MFHNFGSKVIKFKPEPFDANIFKAFAEINLKMIDRDWNLDFKQSFFEYSDTSPHITMRLANFSCNFVGDFDLHTEPAFYTDKGNITIHVYPMTIDLGFTIIEKDGIFELQPSKSDIIYTDMDISFNGTADISFALSAVFKYLKETIKQDASKYLNTILGGGIFPLINNALEDSKQEVEVIKGQIKTNLKATEQPIFSNTSLTLLMKGLSNPVGKNEYPLKPEAVIPSKVDEMAGDIQIFITDYVLNSTLYSAY